jgi:hypothetical protein
MYVSAQNMTLTQFQLIHHDIPLCPANGIALHITATQAQNAMVLGNLGCCSTKVNF